MIWLCAVAVVLFAAWCVWIADPQKRYTRVYLRTSGGGPVTHWTGEVWYDSWGTPFVNGRGLCSGPTGPFEILPDGRTGDYLYKTIWRHRSGPPIDFNRSPTPPRGWR